MNSPRWPRLVLVTLLLALIAPSALSQDVDSIPFLFRGHLYVPACVEGSHQANVIYDTGAADMFGVDSVYLLHSDWKPQKIGNAMTGGGGAGKTLVKIIIGPVKVGIGSIDSEYDMVPIFKLRDVVDCHVDGIWGIKGIEECPFEINFEHNFLKRYKNSQPDLDGYERLPIRYEDDRILLQAQVVIDGKSIKGWYMMDTGSPSVILTAGTVEDFQMESLSGKRHITDITQFGIGDKAQEAIVEMQSQLIVIGSDTIRNEEISYIPEGVGAFSDRIYLGVIGNDVWSSYNIIIDVSHGALYLKRFKENEPLRPTCGFGFRNRTDIGQGWTVSSLLREGKAAKAGLHLNDRIIAVNGRLVEEYTWEEEYDIDNYPELTLDVIGTDSITRKMILTPEPKW